MKSKMNVALKWVNELGKQTNQPTNQLMTSAKMQQKRKKIKEENI